MPIKVKCTCGKVLAVADSASGKMLACPACSRSMVVSSGGAAVAPVATNGVPVGESYDRRCPRCNASMPKDAVLCTVCGFDTRRGRFVTGDLGERKHLNVAAYIGPIAAVILLAAVVWYGPRLLSASATAPKEAPSGAQRSREPASGRTAPRAGQPAERAPAGEAQARSGASRPGGEFAGGDVTSAVALDDASQPYVVTRPVTVLEGGVLTVGPGVVVRGAEGVSLTLSGGELSVEAAAERPAVLALPIAVADPRSALVARRAVFAAGVSIAAARKVLVENCSFTAGISLTPQAPKRPAEWRFDLCEFHPRAKQGDPCLEITSAVPADSLRLWVMRSNFMGVVIGEIERGAEVDVARSYWSAGTSVALAGLARRGRATVEPISSHVVSEAGALPTSQLPALLAPLGAGLIPAQRERVLRNDEVGFELVYPEGWSAVGAGMLTAPASFPRARVGIEWHANDKLPVRLKSRLVVRLRQSGVTGLEATDGDARVVAGIDALDFRCSFVAAGARWTERIVIVPTATGSYAVVLRGREEDMAGLATGFEEILAGFRILGGR